MYVREGHTQNKYGLCSVTGHIEKHVKVDNVSENFCFKLRLLFHISMLSCFFFPSTLFILVHVMVWTRGGGSMNGCRGMRENESSLFSGPDDLLVLWL
jgi:hypothetical protein